MKQALKQLVDISANKLLGNPGTASGNIQEIYLSEDFEFVGATLSLVTTPLYISDMTNVNLLDDTANWDINANYIGATISNTTQGQKHYNDSYLFEAVHDNVWIRLIRG
jgi:hypothetical protein